MAAEGRKSSVSLALHCQTQSQDGEVREIYVNIGSMHAKVIHSLNKHDPGRVKERSLMGAGEKENSKSGAI